MQLNMAFFILLHFTVIMLLLNDRVIKTDQPGFDLHVHKLPIGRIILKVINGCQLSVTSGLSVEGKVRVSVNIIITVVIHTHAVLPEVSCRNPCSRIKHQSIRVLLPVLSYPSDIWTYQGGSKQTEGGRGMPCLLRKQNTAALQTMLIKPNLKHSEWPLQHFLGVWTQLVDWGVYGGLDGCLVWEADRKK